MQSNVITFKYADAVKHANHGEQVESIFDYLHPDTTIGDIRAAFEPEPRRKREFDAGPWCSDGNTIKSRKCDCKQEVCHTDKKVCVEISRDNRPIVEYAPLMYEVMEKARNVIRDYFNSDTTGEKLGEVERLFSDVLDAIDNREDSKKYHEEIVGKND